MIVLFAAAVTTALAAIALPIARRLGEHYGRRQVERELAPTLDARLNRLADSVRTSARLAQEVSAEVDLRAAALRELEEKAKEAEALAALHKDQAEAVERLVQASMANAGKRITRAGIWTSLATFVLGAAVTLLVTLLVHPIG